MQSTLRQRLLASTLMFGAAAFATPAWAQPTDEDIQETPVQTTPDQTGNSDLQEGAVREDGTITVTGSRIQRRDLTSTSPLAVVQDEEFQLSGAVNVEQVINTLPQVIPGATAFSNNPGGGVATLNLRGLGATRTLVLVNGRRWMFFDVSQIVDLNTIPQFLIDSVDVVTGGASAVYGSDALAGVVNFRLESGLDGFQAGGNYSITEEGDGRRYGAHIAVGSSMADGRGNVTAFAEYYNRGSIFQGDRAFSRFALGDGGGALVPFGSATTPQGRIAVAPTSTVPGIDANRDGHFTDPGDTPPRVMTRGVGNFATTFGANFGQPGVSDAFDFPGETYNYAPSNYLMVPQERWLLGGYGEFEITPNVTAFTEVTFVNNRVQNELAATPVTGTFNVNLARACGFLSPADCAALQQLDANETAINAERAARGFGPLFTGANAPSNAAGTVSLGVNRRVLETGPRNSFDERNAFRALGGVRGPITDNLNYEAYYFFARTRNANIQEGNISRSAFQRGLDGSGPALNVFGAGTISPTALEAISILAQNNEISNLQVASAALNGTLGNFGWGGDDIGFAVGGEWRSMSSRFIPDTALSSGDVIGFNAGDPTQGGYNVAEVFAELRIPIIADAPGFHRLELNGAARYSDYSLEAVGGVWTYAAGAEWAPVRDITFRGQYQRAIRAPNVGELFGGQANGFPAATDPCSSRNTSNQTATVRQLCIQTGVPAALVFTAGVQPNNQIEGTFGGNPNLEEETADTYTLGAVIRPRFIPRLSITVDAYDITVEDSISVLGGGLNNTLNLCFNVIQDLQSQFCQAVNRDPATGQIGGNFPVLILNSNIGRLETRGVDFQLDYNTPLGFSMMGGTESRLNFFFLGTYTDRFDITPVADLPDQIDECAGRFGIRACGSPQPRWKWTSRLSLIDGPMTLSGRWRHIGSVRDDDDDTDFIVERLNAKDYFDLAFAFDVSDGLRLTMGVNNLFDTFPQQLGFNQEQANTFPGTYDVIGRDFFISANLRF